MERREQLVRLVEAVYSPAYTAEENCKRISTVFEHVVKLESEVDKPKVQQRPDPDVPPRSDKHKR